MPRKAQNNIKEWGLALLLALLFVGILKTLFFQSYKVSTDKMMGSLHVGDRVFVNKCQYGARLPITPLSLPFVEFLYLKYFQVNPKRLPGFGSIETQDVLVYNQPNVFDLPIDKKPVNFSRCVALPGDTIGIRSKKVYINNKYQKFPSKALFAYRLYSQGLVLDSLWFGQYEIVGGAKVSEIGIYDLPLSLLQEAIIDKDEQVKFIRQLDLVKNSKGADIFPKESDLLWNKDFFGPIVVPFKGQVLHLNTKNISIYADLIRNHEDNKLLITEQGVFINSRPVTEYMITQDYYFVMDDNRDYAYDSRDWGFLPKSHIVGRLQNIWYPYDFMHFVL